MSAGSGFDAEFSIVETPWCVGGVALLRRDRLDAASGEVTTLDWINSAGVVVVPTAPNIAAATPGACPAAEVTEFDIVETVWCVVDRSLIRRDRVNNTTGAVVSFDWTDSAGVLVVPAPADITAAVPGPCFSRLDSKIIRRTGAGTDTIAAGAKSVTVVVIAGAPTVNIGPGIGDGPVSLVAGLTLTWSGSGDGRASGDFLVDQFVFTSLAGDDLIVITTREV
jgi:hypothetical protein